MPVLVGGGVEVRVYDSQGKHGGEHLLPGTSWHDDAYTTAVGADLLVILTEWNEFRALDLLKLSGAMRTARMADLRNVYLPEDARSAGFEAYEGIGRGARRLQKSCSEGTKPPISNCSFWLRLD